MRLLVLLLLVGVSLCAPADNRTTKATNERITDQGQEDILGDEVETFDNQDFGDDEDDESDEEDLEFEVPKYIIHIKSKPKKLTSLLTPKKNNPYDDDDGTEDNNSDKPETRPNAQNRNTKPQREQSIPRKKENNNYTPTPYDDDDGTEDNNSDKPETRPKAQNRNTKPQREQSIPRKKENNNYTPTPYDDEDGTEDNNSDKPETRPNAQNRNTKPQREQSIPRKKENNNYTPTPYDDDDGTEDNNSDKPETRPNAQNRKTKPQREQSIPRKKNESPTTLPMRDYERKKTTLPISTNDSNGNSKLPSTRTKVPDENLNLDDRSTEAPSVATEPQVIKKKPKTRITPVGGKPIQEGTNPSANTPASSRKSNGLKYVIEALTNSLKNPEKEVLNSVIPLIQKSNKPIVNDNQQRFESPNSNKKQSASETSRLPQVQSNWGENKPERNGNIDQLAGSLIWVGNNPLGGTSELGQEPFHWDAHKTKGVVSGIPTRSPVWSGISGFSDTNRRSLDTLNWSERNPMSGVVKQSGDPINWGKNNLLSSINWAADIPVSGNSGSFEGPINWDKKYPTNENNGQPGETLNWDGHNPTGGIVRQYKEPLHWNGNNPSVGTVWGGNIPPSSNSGHLGGELNLGSHSPGRTSEQSRGPLNWNGNDPTSSLSRPLGGVSNWNHENHALKNGLPNGMSIWDGNPNTRVNNGVPNGLLNLSGNQQNGGLSGGIIGRPQTGLETRSAFRN